MRWIMMIAALAAGGAACVPKQNIEASFDPKAAAFIQLQGTGSIKGQAFARQMGGGVVTAAGEEVLLVPNIPFFYEGYTKVRNGIPFDKVSIDLEPYGKKTIADAEGRFKFEALHPGKYIVLSRVRWVVDGSPQGGLVMATTAVANGKQAEVILAR